MSVHTPPRLHLPRRFAGIALLALLAALVASPIPAAATPGILPRGPGFAAWEVQQLDISTLGSPRPGLLVKAFSPSKQDPAPVVRYLDEAARHHQKVLVYFVDTVDYAKGTVAPNKVLNWVNKVKNHTALYGYLSVKEPSWSGISLAEMRQLYNAYKAADKNHPVVALLGDTPHFGTKDNPWAKGVANVLWVDWYPVTTHGYLAGASTNFPKIKAYVAKNTPGTPIWLMVQGHAYSKLGQRSPTAAELRRQVSDGFTYLGAAGIAFYTWQNPIYQSDFKRNTALWNVAKSLIVANSGRVVVTR